MDFEGRTWEVTGAGEDSTVERGVGVEEEEEEATTGLLTGVGVVLVAAEVVEVEGVVDSMGLEER